MEDEDDDDEEDDEEDDDEDEEVAMLKAKVAKLEKEVEKLKEEKVSESRPRNAKTVKNVSSVHYSLFFYHFVNV